MVDDGVKISALNEVLTEPATGEMVASVVGGVTYKRNIGSRLPSTTQKSALAGYGGTPSGTNPYATQATVKPLSDLSRVMQINGDGVPTFPDNVAGATQFVKESNTETWPLWNASHGTKTVTNGVIRSTATTTEAGLQTSADVNSKLCVFKVRASKPMTLTVTAVVGTDNIVMGYLNVGTNWCVCTAYKDLSATASSIYFMSGGLSSVDWIEMSSSYIGSGLYDTPVYGKDGRSIWTNHGVLPVNSKRGKGLLFQGARYLESPDKLGTSGSIAFKFNRKQIGIYEQVIANYEYATKTGVAFYINADNVLVISYGDGTSELAQIIDVSVDADGLHDYVVNYTATTVGPVFKDGVLVQEQVPLASTIIQTTSPTRIGCPLWSTTAHLLNGQLDDILVRSTPMTQDDAIRYHNGDDAVDSQQKAITNVPNAIKICDSKGNIRQPGLPVYADNAAALAGGLVAGEPYRTSTGVMMITY